MTNRTGPYGGAVLLVFVLASVSSGIAGAGEGPAGEQPPPAVLGSWDGVIVYVPAEQEVEIAVELVQDVMGKLGGLIDVPTKPIDDEPLVNLKVEGNAISWELRRDTGVFPYRGTISADGNEIRGRYEERGKTFDFWLRRRDPAAPPRAPVQPPLHPLSAGGAELKEKFEADAGNVRLVMLLSPG
jgi:hypothetical protein